MSNKWELIEENSPMIFTRRTLWGELIEHKRIFVDVYRKMKWNGIYKYKNVERDPTHYENLGLSDYVDSILDKYRY